MSLIRLQPLEGRSDFARSLFWDNMLIGQPLPFALNCQEQFERFCIGWYLANPRDSVVAVNGNQIVGYALVCTDHESFKRSERRNIVVLAFAILGAVLSLRINRQSLEFFARRLFDSFSIVMSRRAIPDDVNVHAHVNVAHAHHDGTVARMLRDHIDTTCLGLGRSGWFGEMNAVGGSRIVGIQRVVGKVVSVSRNSTFSWLMGEPVSRLTTVRTVTDDQAA